MSIETTTTPSKVFNAHLYDHPGTLAKLDGEIIFMETETHALTTIEPEHIAFLAVLGEVGIAEAQKVMDTLHGGYAAIACSRGEAWVRHMLYNDTASCQLVA